MESDETRQQLREALREADRAEAAPWTEYPPTPRWYPFAVGVWAALLTLAFAGLEDRTRLAATLGLIAVELLFLRWYVGYRGGVMPTGSAPREFRGAIALFVAAATVIVLGTAALLHTVTMWASAAFALVTVTITIGWYERAYARAAARTRARLS